MSLFPFSAGSHSDLCHHEGVLGPRPWGPPHGPLRRWASLWIGGRARQTVQPELLSGEDPGGAEETDRGGHPGGGGENQSNPEHHSCGQLHERQEVRQDAEPVSTEAPAVVWWGFLFWTLRKVVSVSHRFITQQKPTGTVGLLLFKNCKSSEPKRKNQETGKPGLSLQSAGFSPKNISMWESRKQYKLNQICLMCTLLWHTYALQRFILIMSFCNITCFDLRVPLCSNLSQNNYRLSSLMAVYYRKTGRCEFLCVWMCWFSSDSPVW